MSLVIVSGGPPLGFSITSALKSVAKTTYDVAKDPRTQALVAAAGQQYAPGATSQVMQVTHNVQQKIRQARRFLNPQGQVVMVQPGQMPPPGAVPAPPPVDDAGPPDDGGGGPPLQAHHGMLLIGGAIGAVVLVLLLTK